MLGLGAKRLLSSSFSSASSSSLRGAVAGATRHASRRSSSSALPIRPSLQQQQQKIITRNATTTTTTTTTPPPPAASGPPPVPPPSATPSGPPPPSSPLNLLLTIPGFLLAAGILDMYANDGNLAIPTIYYLLDHPGMALLRQLDPERAHDLAIWALSKELIPQNKTSTSTTTTAASSSSSSPSPSLEVSMWNGLLTFPNPIGVAAGFDKHAQAMKGLLGLGLGFVEIGSVTPLPQEGNPKPRMFRLVEDRAVINRYGFNSDGLAVVKRRLQDYWEERLRRQGTGTGTGTGKGGGQQPEGIIGVNVGKNKATIEAEEDYTKGVRELGAYADYLVINVSSPNTPGLRSLQRKGAFESLIRAVQKELKQSVPTNIHGRRVPLLIKVAPDLTEDEKKDIAAVALSTKIDGLIVSNTTITRPETLQSKHAPETGGLSGAPLKALSTQTIHDLYRLTKHGKVPIIGVGGVGSGEDAYEKIRAGASLVQVYSMLVYEGPGAVKRINEELRACLCRDGFASVEEAVGVAHKPHVIVMDVGKGGGGGRGVMKRLWGGGFGK